MAVPKKNLKKMTQEEMAEHLGIMMDIGMIDPAEAPDETEILEEA
jgi:hypothetical protein